MDSDIPPLSQPAAPPGFLPGATLITACLLLAAWWQTRYVADAGFLVAWGGGFASWLACLPVIQAQHPQSLAGRIAWAVATTVLLGLAILFVSPTLGVWTRLGYLALLPIPSVALGTSWLDFIQADARRSRVWQRHSRHWYRKHLYQRMTNDELKQNLARLTESYRQVSGFYQLVERLDDALILCDAESLSIFYANHSACRQLGMTPDSWGDYRLNTLMPAEDNESIHRLAELIINQRLRHLSYETVLQQPNGEIFPVELSWHALETGDDHRYVVIQFKTIEERRQAVQSRERFLSQLLYQLRSPLSVVKGALGLVDGGNIAADELLRQELIHMARENVDRLCRSIEHTADEYLSGDRYRLTPVDEEPIDMPQMIADIKDRLSSQRLIAGVDVSLELHGRSDEFVVYGSRRDLSRAFAVVLENAIQYSPPRSAVVVRMTSPAQMLLVEVIDQGQGIAPEAVATLFEPVLHRQVEAGLQGVGLALAGQVVRQHRGKISYHRSEQDETVFSIALPRAQADARVRVAG